MDSPMLGTGVDELRELMEWRELRDVLMEESCDGLWEWCVVDDEVAPDTVDVVDMVDILSEMFLVKPIEEVWLVMSCCTTGVQIREACGRVWVYSYYANERM